VKLREVNISFVMSVGPSTRPSVHPHGKTWLPLEWFCTKFCIRGFFENV